MRTAFAHAGPALLFCLLATANAGGYRYGVSDQAFYVPAVMRAADPAAFPRDGELLATQTGLTAADDAMAAAGALGLGWPVVFLVFYVATTLTLYAGAVAVCRAFGFSPWATWACLLLMTFRHRIARTGVNSLEGYAHPRELAFGVGLLALACAVRRRHGWSLAVAAAAGLVHPTTALWFLAVAVVTAAVDRPAWRRRLAIAGAAAAVAGVLAAVAGPLAPRLAVMDEAWLAVLAGKDYLFPFEWPAYAWASNLAYGVVIALIAARRRRLRAAVAGERALLAGLLALVVGFVVSVPLTELRLALAVQLQVTRVFWVLDFVTAAYVGWWLTSLRASRAWAPAVVALLALLSAGRGAYVLTVEHPERRLVEATLPHTPWIDTMRWLSTQPAAWHVLADPDHGWKYGVSVRVAAGRDTLLETSKDSAMALYDRRMALRVAERIDAVGTYAALDTAAVRRLAERFGLDVAVTEAGHVLDLPRLYANDAFTVYDVR